VHASASTGLVLVLGLCGCAVTRVDGDGTTHVSGLVNIRIPPAGQSVSTIEVTSLGVAILKAELSTGISLGYSTHRVTSAPNDACVIVK
jgi:hypothetical protein